MPYQATQSSRGQSTTDRQRQHEGLKCAFVQHAATWTPRYALNKIDLHVAFSTFTYRMRVVVTEASVCICWLAGVLIAYSFSLCGAGQKSTSARTEGTCLRSPFGSMNHVSRHRITSYVRCTAHQYAYCYIILIRDREWVFHSFLFFSLS